ncbi:MAG: M23 family metallopeptidase [Patescibacteria group bacterium]|nr:M23 family metallopeptidase [Patescibacteria group bacterium]
MIKKDRTVYTSNINFEAIDQTYKIQVNKLARKERHSRVFDRTSLYKSKVFKAVSSAQRSISSVGRLVFRNRAFTMIEAFLDRLPTSTTRRLMRRIAIYSVALLVLTSVSPYGAVTGASYTAVDNYYSGELYLVADQEGYLTKSNPQTLDGDRGTMTDRVVHTVASGETVSEIATKYGLKSETLLWENNIYNPNSIKIGQKLVVPPVNGIGHKVKSGDTLDKLAKKYSVDKEDIVKQNQIEGELLAIGTEVFIPGGKAIDSPYYDTRSLPSRTGTPSRYVGNANLPGSSASPVIGKPMIFPTRGKVTQGWRWGHYAFDIADTSKPPVWSAMGGTVESAESGWSGGYGNHVVVDHGNGLKTLYAHLEYYTVQPGQTVSQGQVIGKMGRTGRVYGVTGIHLHFEVIENGVKQYPGNYW